LSGAGDKNFMIYDVVIIGGASAGLTAGIYAARKKLNAVILAKQVGGQSLLTDRIENFPGFEMIAGRDLIDKMRKQVEKYGVPVREDAEVESIKKKGEIFLIKLKEIGFPEGNPISFRAKTIIIATGKKYRQPDISGVKKFENKGVSFCTTCDAPFFKDKRVAIIGSGNSALNAAIDLVKYADKIYVLARGPKIKGDELLLETTKQNGKIEFLYEAEVREIKGDNFVEKIIYKDKKTGEEKELKVEGVFVNIGWVPATSFLKDLVNLNDVGEIIINPRTNETSIPGIFAAGDVTDVKYKQCVIAAAEGAKAALSAYNYLTSSN
jgi:thioredoxin-disulfide reductase